MRPLAISPSRSTGNWRTASPKASHPVRACNRSTCGFCENCTPPDNFHESQRQHAELQPNSACALLLICFGASETRSKPVRGTEARAKTASKPPYNRGHNRERIAQTPSPSLRTIDTRLSIAARYNRRVAKTHFRTRRLRCARSRPACPTCGCKLFQLLLHYWLRSIFAFSSVVV